jgi:3-dehydroquinate dehydratase-2
MKLMVINGPNINMLGIREKGIYGSETYVYLCEMIKKHCDLNSIEVEIYQSNHEGDIVDKIQDVYLKHYDGLILNPAAYTHTSVAILDAIKAINPIPTVEVHISDISQRDDFRQFSYTSLAAKKIIMGQGLKGYILAIDYLIKI